MTIDKDAYRGKCEVCGASAPVHVMPHAEYKCRFCGFKKIFTDDDKYDLDPLLKMAIGHYQFEAIHPFPDGNGRTGRILNTIA